MIRRLATSALPLAALATAAGAQTPAVTPAATPSTGNSQSISAPDNALELEEVEVTAPRVNLLGTATTASQGVVNEEEIQLTPIYRPGQILETIPGLTVTAHSGEGKANQYLLRGYNLDHGTDLETYVDAMPINQPTHAHGQGYTDLNFMIPELADQITYTKGPYYANVGDFGAVGSDENQLPGLDPGSVYRDRRDVWLRAVPWRGNAAARPGPDTRGHGTAALRRPICKPR